MQASSEAETAVTPSFATATSMIVSLCPHHLATCVPLRPSQTPMDLSTLQERSMSLLGCHMSFVTACLQCAHARRACTCQCVPLSVSDCGTWEVKARAAPRGRNKLQHGETRHGESSYRFVRALETRSGLMSVVDKYESVDASSRHVLHRVGDTDRLDAKRVVRVQGHELGRERTVGGDGEVGQDGRCVLGPREDHVTFGVEARDRPLVKRPYALSARIVSTHHIRTTRHHHRPAEVSRRRGQDKKSAGAIDQ